ncbi:MAG TPA: hypothetical protein PKH33_10465 [bacterium]|nr:hypothetical protein [bacterium]
MLSAVSRDMRERFFNLRNGMLIRDRHHRLKLKENRALISFHNLFMRSLYEFRGMRIEHLLKRINPFIMFAIIPPTIIFGSQSQQAF